MTLNTEIDMTLQQFLLYVTRISTDQPVGVTAARWRAMHKWMWRRIELGEPFEWEK